MKKWLQMFATAEAVKGKKIVYLWRPFEDGTTQTGAVVAFVTENSREVSKDAETTSTKDGSIRTPSDAEITISFTSILKKGDAAIADLEDAMLGDKLIEAWEANLEEPATGQNQFKGRYYQGYFTSLSLSSPAEGFVEASMQFAANGKGATGNVTVTQEQQDAAAYVFADTTKRMYATPDTLSVQAGGTGTATITNATGTITAIAAGSGISATVSTATVTVSVAAATAAGTKGTVTCTDAGGNTCVIAVTVAAAQA